jgi:hypothetical protein
VGGKSDVWVVVGEHRVRADTIQRVTVHTVGNAKLKVTGSREPLWISVASQYAGSYGDSVTEERLAELADELVRAIETAARSGQGHRIALDSDGRGSRHWISEELTAL